MLTIAIPTYQRAAQLDRQLAWLAAAVQGHEDQVELVVSDNCSSDDTPEVTARWQRVLGPGLLEVRRQPENIGAVRNIQDCLVRARRRHVWVPGDDDVIQTRAVSAVLERLVRHPDVALLTLNFSSRSAVTGQQRFARCFDVQHERLREDGADAFMEMLLEDQGGVGLTTAQVYRSDLVRRGVESWGPEHRDNLAVQIYWGAFCAAHGSVLLTQETLLECTADTHFFLADPAVHLRLGFADRPEVAMRMEQLGYPWEGLRQLVLDQLALHQAPLALQALRHDPRSTAATASVFARALRRVGPSATGQHLSRKVRERLRRPAEAVGVPTCGR